MSIKDWLRDKSNSDTEFLSEENKVFDGKTTLSFDDIACGMQHAATAANRMIAHQYMLALDPFFEQTNDGRLKPKFIEMSLDDNHHFKLPLVSLTTPHGLMLEKMKVFLTVRTEAVESLSQQESIGGNAPSRFIVSLSPPSTQTDGRDSGHVDIEMQFTVLPPPEGVMRIIDEYTRSVLPISNSNPGDTHHA